MQKKNNKGVIALIIVLVLAAAALVIWQTNKPETQQGGKDITINVDHLNGDDTTFTIHTDEEYLRGAHWSARRKRQAEENSKKHLPSRQVLFVWSCRFSAYKCQNSVSSSSENSRSLTAKRSMPCSSP